MKEKLETAELLAKKFMNILELEKQIEVVQGEKPFTEVKVLRKGKIVPEHREKTAILNNEYDTIRIILHGKIPILEKLPKDMQTMLFVETIFHELLHVKHPDWDEEKIRDFSAEFMGMLNRTLF